MCDNIPFASSDFYVFLSTLQACFFRYKVNWTSLILFTLTFAHSCKGGYVPINFWYNVCVWGSSLQTNKLMQKSRTSGTNMVFVCYLLLKEAKTNINMICFDRNFDHSHISEVTFVLRKQSKTPQYFPQKIVLCLKVFGMYLLLGLSSLFSQNSRAMFLKNCYLTLFDMGGHDGPPKMFLTTLLKCLGGRSWQRVCQGVLEIFWSYRSICFLITKF